jgi:hypothetical protein
MAAWTAGWGAGTVENGQNLHKILQFILASEKTVVSLPGPLD